MKSFFIFLLMIAGSYLSAQDGWVYSISKDGKESHKECKAMKAEPMMVWFHVSGATYEIFDLIGNDLNGLPLWQSRATGKTAYRTTQTDGTVVFWKSDKKAFYYKP